jgi:ribosomal protein L40E
VSIDGVRTSERTVCPYCLARNTRATSVNDEDAGAVPGEGDISICIKCGAVSIFRADPTLRFPTKSEATSWDQETLSALARAQSALRAAHRETGA